MQHLVMPSTSGRRRRVPIRAATLSLTPSVLEAEYFAPLFRSLLPDLSPLQERLRKRFTLSLSRMNLPDPKLVWERLLRQHGVEPWQPPQDTPASQLRGS
jgi:hypothetical protein